MLKSNVKFGIMAAAALMLTLSACKKNKDIIPDVEENELITKVSLKFTNAANAADVATVTWTDPDGDGGTPPTIGTLTLKPNTNYNFEVSEVRNETASTEAGKNILAEIVEESDEHLWVYKPNVALNLSLTRTDKDQNNVVIGLKGTANAGTASTGLLQVILRHQPDGKDGSETPGSTDFETVFPVKIQ